MKKILNTFVVFAAMTAMVSVSSCTKTCDAGYEGSDCKTEIRSNYYGIYTLSGTDTDGDTYSNLQTTVASGGTDVFQMNITMVGNGLTVPFTGKLDPNSTSTFSVPTFPFAGEQFTGSGSFSGKLMTLQLVGPSYTINLNGNRP
jgi:hypothetical protein